MTELQAYLHSLFLYEPETGFLFWKKREGDSHSVSVFNSRFVGKKVGYVKKPKRSKTTYLATLIDKKYETVHRIIFAMHHGYMPEQVDHIDHDGMNNRIENLRASNSKDNSRNLPMQKSNKSGHIGVNWHKSAKKWQARAVDKNGKRVDLGRFDDINDAIAIRKKYEVEFGYYENRGSL